MARVHWQCFQGKTADNSDTRQSLLYLPMLGERYTDRIVSIGQGEKGRYDIVVNIARIIMLNFANVNIDLDRVQFCLVTR